MEAKVTAEAVEVQARVKASPETVFSYFTDPEKIVRWKGATAELDPRPGGIHRVQIRPEVVALGEYVEVDPPRRVVLSWGWEGHPAVPAGSTRVEISLEPDGEETLVTLRHLDLPEAERDQHLDGWKHYLSRFEVAAAGGDPGPDPNENPPKQPT